MSCSSPLKRKADDVSTEYDGYRSPRREPDDAVLSPSKKRRLETKPMPTTAKRQHKLTTSVPRDDLSNTFSMLSLNQQNQLTHPNGNTDPEYGKSLSSTIQPAPETPFRPREPSLALAVYFNTQFHDFILVKPSFAAGGFAKCSIWLGLSDRKLYVRKLQRSRSTPRDITHCVQHPGIPKLVASLQHGMNPVKRTPAKVDSCKPLQSAIGFPSKNMSEKPYWSTMSEYVNGPTLWSVFEKFAGRDYAFPEPAIWQCGKVLLEIIRKLRFPDPSKGDHHIHPMSHNDTYARNILLTNNNDPAATTDFHLIDFGMATFQSEPGFRTGDLSNVTDILYSMMLNQNVGPVAKNRVERAKEEPGWRYSNELTIKVAEMEFNNRNSIPYGFPSKFWLNKWVNSFTAMAARTSKEFNKAGKSLKIPLQEPMTIGQPWLFRGEDAEEKMKHYMANQSGCSPYQHAWLEDESLRLVEVGENLYWNKPELDAPL